MLAIFRGHVAAQCVHFVQRSCLGEYLTMQGAMQKSIGECSIDSADREGGAKLCSPGLFRDIAQQSRQRAGSDAIIR